MSATRGEVDRMIDFVKALTDHYGATQITNPKGHRQFRNPWAYAGGDPGYIFILKGTGTIRFGTSVTRSTRMSERMIDQIASRRLGRNGMVQAACTAA